MENKEGLNKNNPNEALKMTELTQTEADSLIKMDKVFIDRSPLLINSINTQRELLSKTNPEIKFFLNIRQTALEFGVFSSVNRFFSQPLMRICVNEDSRHENPDGSVITGSHIHIYKENHQDRWAYPISDYGFISEEIISCIERFLSVCSIEKITIQRQKTVGEV